VPERAIFSQLLGQNEGGVGLITPKRASVAGVTAPACGSQPQLGLRQLPREKRLEGFHPGYFCERSRKNRKNLVGD